MNAPLLRTLLIAVIAAITSAAAAYVYPWPEKVVQSDAIGEMLFATYDAAAVRSIRIEKFNIDQNGFEQIQLDRIGETWVIPSRKNFIATNSLQVSLATSSLDEKTVHEERTDEKRDHVKYGVVDPSEFEATSNRSALGTKITLEGRNREKMGSLIVGKRVGSVGGLNVNPMQPGKFFVRIPGQPSVYVIDFQPAALTTDFRNWVDSNLFEINDLIQLNRFRVEDYRIDPKTLDIASRQDRYRAYVSAGQPLLVEMYTNDTWTAVAINQEIQERMRLIFEQIHMIAVSDVVRKTPGLAKLFRSPDPNAKLEDFDSLKSYGFLVAGFNNSNYEFDASGGELAIEFADGVSISMYIGSAVETSNTDNSNDGRYVMMSAGVNEEVYPVPPEPLETDDAAKAEAQNKAYLRRVEERKEGLQAAHQRADGLNQRYGDWIYVVSDAMVENLRPNLTLTAAANPPESETEKDEKGNDTKPAETESGEPKSGESKSAEPKAGESKSDESKENAQKPSEAKPGESKASESKSGKPKPKSPKNDPFG